MSRESFILALDQGTTSSRAILFDRSGRIQSLQQKEFTQYFPKPGRVEHDPEEIWSSQREVMLDTLELGGIQPGQVAAIGIANQRETVVVWDKHSGKPICPAIVWQDRRTTDICTRLTQDGHQAAVHRRTGLRLDPYFSATKLTWILDNIPGARARANNGEVLFGTIDSWLLWKLTAGQVHATDVSNASRTLLLDLATGEWADDMLELFRIPREMLPEVRSSSEVYGTLTSGLLDGNIPISGMAGDQQAALFGQACTRAGMCKNTYGTGCFLLMNTGCKPCFSTNELLTTIAWKLDGTLTYALEGSVFVAGAAVQWLRDGLALINSAHECDTLAASVSDSGGVYLVPAFTGLGAPYWDPDARGTLVGMTRGTGKAHLCRAVLEAIAFQSVELIECMRRDYGGKQGELRVDGGAARSDCLMQIQADFLNSPVCRPLCTETTALGAAYLAGLAIGFWDGLEDIETSWKPGMVFRPVLEEATRLSARLNWNRAVQRSRKWSDPG